MGKSKVAMLLLWVLFVSCAKARKLSPLEIQIEAKLKLLNKPAVKTIKSEDGDIIDCVDIYKQPAFDHPALKNHRIKAIPNFVGESRMKVESKSVIFQSWQKSGSCPEGTVPIRRILKEDLLRAASLDRFGQKPPAVFKHSTNGYNSNDFYLPAPENRSAAYLLTTGQNYKGAQADINVWNPKVDLPDDFTTAQIWLKTANGIDFESVEAGWMVNPKLHGDNKTRLFVYWTQDSYKSTGCFDLTCSGFVQIGQQAVGLPIAHMSSQGAIQYELNLGIFLDDSGSGNWYLKINNDVPVGYWPGEILSNLRHSATVVEWGGQVSSWHTKNITPHTGTEMGSGEFADGLWGNASFMRNVRIKDTSLQLKYPEPANAKADESHCYNSINHFYDNKDLEPVFYFGGPGRNSPDCP